MEETVLMSADGIYRWRGPKSKSTLAGTKLGRLILTNQRLIFLSSGGSDAMRRAAGAAVSGPAGGLLAAGKTDSLDLSALANEGSLSIPLNELHHYEFIKKRFRNYLSISFTNADGNSEAYAFMNQHGLPGGPSWAEAIAGAKG